MSTQENQPTRFDADNLITAVEMDADRTRIAYCEVYPLVDGLAGDRPLPVSRDHVVADIRNGRRVRTALWVDGTLREGAKVCLIGDVFLRTDGNNILEDNLGELPEFRHKSPRL